MSARGAAKQQRMEQFLGELEQKINEKLDQYTARIKERASEETVADLKDALKQLGFPGKFTYMRKDELV